MGFEVKRVRMEAESLTGVTDEFATAVFTEECFYVEGFFADAVGVSWNELARLLDDPFAQAKLDEARLLLGR